MESKKRAIVLLLSLLGLCMQMAVYVYAWMEIYYPYLAQFGKVNFYSWGHRLTLGIYFVLLFFFENTYGGLKIGRIIYHLNS